MRDADGRLLRTYKDGEAKLNAYLEDHAFLLEALLTLYEASFERALVRRRARDRRRDDRALRRSRARRLLHHLQRSRAADRPPQGRRRPPDPVRATRPPPSACCASRRSPASAATSEQAESGLRACSAASPRATRRRSPTCCARSTSTPSPVREVALVAPGRRRRARRARRRGALASCARTSCSPAGREGSERPELMAGAHGGRRPRRRLRLRALRLPGPGHRPGRARRGARRRDPNRLHAMADEPRRRPRRARKKGAKTIVREYFDGLADQDLDRALAVWKPGGDRPHVRDGRPRRPRPGSAPGSRNLFARLPRLALRGPRAGRERRARGRPLAHLGDLRRPGPVPGPRPDRRRGRRWRAATCSASSTSRSSRTTPTRTAPTSPSSSACCRPSGSSAERAMTGAFNAKTAATARAAQAARAERRPGSAVRGGCGCAGSPPCRAGGGRRASTRARSVERLRRRASMFS